MELKLPKLHMRVHMLNVSLQTRLSRHIEIGEFERHNWSGAELN